MAVHEKPGQAEPKERAWTAPVRFGNYLLMRRLAVGGMSEVFLARPVGDEQSPAVIIKRLLPGVLDEPQNRASFATEARLHRAAQHPNVVEVLDAGEVDGEPYLALEYVAGVDAFRLMRRAQAELRSIPHGMAVHIARRLCDALACVHQLKDEEGISLGVVHRDVTPSNIYLSDTGEVKLGDFGIARATGSDQGSRALKGKYAYLAPEQVSGESFDHRADLFSLAVVLAELLIGQSLFPGAGQLAVLLAIRDCRIDPLRASAHLLPRGLYSVLDRALARSPDRRYASALELGDALTPFDPSPPSETSEELARWVVWAADSDTLARRIEDALRDAQALGNGSVHPQGNRTATAYREHEQTREPKTMPAPAPTANVRTQSGRDLQGLTLATLIELIVTGQLDGNDEVAMANEPFRRLQHVDLLARHLSPCTATTHRLEGPGVPDYVVELAVTPMLEVLSWILVHRETGALFADRPAPVDSSRLPASGGSAEADRRRRAADLEGGAGTRKEIYVERGKVVLVASSERSELFGEYLVAQGLLRRDELDLALAALSRYDGRLGDTLIGLGLVDAVDVFRAIQNQGRARVADVFRWNSGRVSFYRGVTVQRIEFRLDLDIPDLMLAGVERTETEARLEETFRGSFESLFTAVRPPPPHALEASWPPSVLALVGALGSGRTLAHLVEALRTRNKMRPTDTLRALVVAIAGGIVEKRKK